MMIAHRPLPRRTVLFAAAASLVLALFGAGCSKQADTSGSAGDGAVPTTGRIKLGFIVKQPEEPWFQLEWKFAKQAAAEFGFDLQTTGARDGGAALSAIDNLAASGAKGFVICTPDVNLGPAIVNRANQHGLKVLAVDDRFLGHDGKPMEDVHYLGISARKIGEMVGHGLYAEMKRRNWPVEETGVCVVTFNQLDTARERTEGATAALLEDGFPRERVFTAPQKTSDIPGAIDAVSVLLVQQPQVKRWLICGMNDSAVLGAVRALESRQYAADNVIGIGINGTDCITEFEKSQPTGFFASVLLSARTHGYETAKMLHQWVKDGKEPPLDTRTTGVLINRENFVQVLKEQGVRE